MEHGRLQTAWLLSVSLLGGTFAAFAGAPFVTDDPIPTDYHCWEVYIASQHAKSVDGWSGTAGLIEADYGVVSNVQLHVIAPFAYDAPRGGRTQVGYGDTEFGAKIRLVQQSDKLPDIAIYPAVQVPTGSESRGLGSGHVQAFFPLWLQKDFGQWTVYGGGGYGINPGEGNTDWGIAGILVQRQLTKQFALGTEIYHRTPTETGGRHETAFNIGAVVDFSERDHLLISLGRSIAGPTQFQAYVGLRFNFGP